jgi:hypothetical protein
MNYWLVGAMWGGEEDTLDVFLKRGYWYAWDPKENSKITQQVKDGFPKIKTGDRIAVKKMLGKGSKEIQIRAIGIVKDIDKHEWRAYVDWKLINLDKKVPIRGCMGSLHGPYTLNNDTDCWLKNIFCI